MKKILLIILAVLSCSNSESSSGRQGPLFIQVHFTNSIDSISNENLVMLLAGKINNFSMLDGAEKRINLYVDNNIKKVFSLKYPDLSFRAGDFKKSFISDKASIIGDKGFLGISDIKGLTPCFKVLKINGSLPWGTDQKDYTFSKTGTYPFTIKDAIPWDSAEHITVIQTGVTAMTRTFIRSVERDNDIYKPVKYTSGITSQADISVTSNEVSFLDPCRYPLKNNLSFCSPAKYFKILEKSGFDIIELTGNHNNDFGRKHNRNTMKRIKQSGMTYFGGGLNKNDAERVLYINLKGYVIAFTGFNQWGPSIAWATGSNPGAARLNRKLFIRNVKEAVEKADIVFVSVQWGNETDPVPHKTQVEYFHLAGKLGANVMMSSSAHRAMGVEFYKGTFISYGLGNFLFDQMQSVNHRRGFIARHHIYMGDHIQTELIPYMIYNYSQPRLLYGKNAEKLERLIYRYSLGSVFRPGRVRKK